MATPRRQSSLKPHLNQIREWVAEGATDLWIGHQLETTPSAVARFRRQQGILRDRAGRKPSGPDAGGGPAGTDGFASAAPETAVADGPSDAAPVETSPAQPPEGGTADADAPPADKPAPRPRKRRGRKADEEPVAEHDPEPEAAAAVAGAAVAESLDTPAAEAFASDEAVSTEDQPTRDGEPDGEEPRSRRRGRRGGRGRRRENEGEESSDHGPDRTPEDGRAPAAEASAPALDAVELEGVFDQGTDGFGLWLDAGIRDADVYQSHWKGKRDLVVTVTADQIVLRRA